MYITCAICSHSVRVSMYKLCSHMDTACKGIYGEDICKMYIICNGCQTGCIIGMVSRFSGASIPIAARLTPRA